ncbi:MAG TPA: MFS transporter [Amycolatopsis sp.]|nr:MFS transporter [Amycolatopsis sp.]
MVQLSFVVINWADKAILGLIAGPVMKEFGLSAAQFGFVGSSFSFLFSITALVGGVIADRTSLRWMMFALAALWSLTTVPVLAAGTFGALLASRIALGAAEGPAAGVAHSLTYTWFPNDRRGLPAAVLTSGTSISKIAFAPLLAVVIAAFGWRAGFVALAIAALVWCLLWLSVGRTGPYAARPTSTTAEATSPGAKGPHGQVPARVSLLRVVCTGTFIGLVTTFIAQYALVSVILTWLPSYFRAVWGFSEVRSGSLLGLPSITGMACVVLAGWLTDRLLRRGVSSRAARGAVGGIAVALGGVALALIPVISSPVVGVALLLIGYGLAASVQAVANPAIVELVPPACRSSVLGVFLAIGYLGGLVAPWLTGVVVDGAPDPATGYGRAFQIFGVALVVTGLLCLMIVNPERDARRLAGQRTRGFDHRTGANCHS